MAEAHEDDDIFVYMGGDQVVPLNVRRVKIDKSVKIITSQAFEHRRRLIYVEFHDGIEIIGKWAFHGCISLKSLVKLLGVKVIEIGAFNDCSGASEVEFGDKLESIGKCAFQDCTSLRTIKMPSVRSIGNWAFSSCVRLIDLDLPEALETVEEFAFHNCQRLGRISMPLKDGMIEDVVFTFCPKLATVYLVGGIHNTVASLHLERWRNEMKREINRINQVLPTTDSAENENTEAIQQWIRSVIRQIGHYKTQHKELLKDATTILELALWKAKMNEKEEDSLGEVKAKKIKLDMQSERSERRITSGANIVIKNVLPYLELK
ncbi:leucine-rich repeat domain-containing protein [Skeletonema marinoi]|uniref:Leucine-rich repeat domain-containing protein n=1 Tax=Skeletonema marinoi TaxID=267567 RepID=A0AAD8YCS1_9STRA|nr:leucine-rich repeat domain-containing protein [Skeletonema marinoi]